jgi:hypothetical protein
MFDEALLVADRRSLAGVQIGETGEFINHSKNICVSNDVPPDYTAQIRGSPEITCGPSLMHRDGLI